jgi:tripartite-type tricarboxylate transporter receptor subunit TctC
LKKVSLFFAALAMTISAAATEVVQVVWPYALGNNQGNHIRTMVENANKNQDKYQFIFVSKPGAGGTISANAVLNSYKPAILAMSSSFYVTPLISKEGYDVDKFTMLATMCVDRPLAVFTKTLNTIEGNNKMLFIGGAGGIQSFIPRLINHTAPTIQMTQVPFKSGPDATAAMMGGHIDASVDWLGAYNTVVSLGNGVKVIGITGQRSVIEKVPTLPGTEHLVADLLLFVPTSIDTAIYKEFYQIFNAAQDDRTDLFCKNDFGKPIKIEFNNLGKLHETYKTRWKKMTQGIKLE